MINKQIEIINSFFDGGIVKRALIFLQLDSLRQ